MQPNKSFSQRNSRKKKIKTRVLSSAKASQAEYSLIWHNKGEANVVVVG